MFICTVLAYQAHEMMLRAAHWHVKHQQGRLTSISVQSNPTPGHKQWRHPPHLTNRLEQAEMITSAFLLKNADEDQRSRTSRLGVPEAAPKMTMIVVFHTDN